MLLTGPWLFMCFATKYYYLTPFWIKLASLVLVLVFTFTIRRRAVSSSVATHPKRVLLAITSLALWFVVALGGRLIGFP